MMIQWFEDKITMSVPPTDESLARLSRYAGIYAEHGQVAASLACVLCRLVVECKVKGASLNGALQAFTNENKVYYLPDLPLPTIEYDDIKKIIAIERTEGIQYLGYDLCAIFPLAKRLGVDPDQLLFVAIVAAEVLFCKPEEEIEVPIQIDLEQVKALFGV